MATTLPRKQRALGRQIEGYDEARWCEERNAIVQRENWLQFTQCTNVTSLALDDVGEPVPLKTLLLGTGEQDLVEASPFDPTWGIGFRAAEAKTVVRARWGLNLLGKALMYTREAIRRQDQGEL